MNTAEWWWETQEKIGGVGATVCPVIIGSDKTQLTRFSGDQQAWPVYLTIGNIDTATRRTPSSRSTVLLGYLPVTKLETFKKENRSAVLHQLFHDCMATMLEPLKTAGLKGVEMECVDGYVRMIHTILAAYIADYPEQCLVACCRENSCPICLVKPKQRGNLDDNSPHRNQTDTLNFIEQKNAGDHPPEFVDHNLRLIDPFWRNLPHCNISDCFNPDLLHEFHNGAFGDHLVSWTSEAMQGVGPEIDNRFRAMTPHPTLRHFKKGITLTSQWTGKEHKEMEKVYLGVLANATDPRVVRATRGALDFIYYAHFETHSDESLALMDAAWELFHSNKVVFEELQIRPHFNISKIHKLKHWTDSIRARGITSSFNTELNERLHIDFAKSGYRASNRKDYIPQMIAWLARQEAVRKFTSYLEWAVPEYKAKFIALDSDSPAEPTDPASPDGQNTTAASTSAGAIDVSESAVADAPEAAVSDEPRHLVSKRPAYPSVNADSMDTDFHAPDFLFRLDDFLRSQSIPSIQQFTNTSTFPVYKRLSVDLPRVVEITTRPTLDKIRAVKTEPRKETPNGIKTEKPGQFDTVLVRTSPTNAQDPLEGVRVARVRVIFRVPDTYAVVDDPLAYIEWYTPLTRINTDLGMYEISPSTRNHRLHSQVVRVTDILRSCHLIPVFGAKEIGSTLVSEHVLDQCSKFYLNPYLRHHDFYLLRYLPDLLALRKREELQRARTRRLGRAARFLDNV
ncbi:hypothetical protein C8F01DRAFT_1027294 [Mycena amicta]|nr:hypothetical protein C8F01DRAFT_1027294 [Mycena amicta]